MIHILLSAANQQQIPVTVAVGCVVRSTPISYLYPAITAIFRPQRGTQATASKLGIAEDRVCLPEGRTRGTYAFAGTGFDRGSVSERLRKDCERVSRNDRKTSTENPIRNAIASGDIEADCPSVKLLNRPTTPPAIAATTKCAELASD